MKALDVAIEQAGGVGRLAAACGVVQGAVSNWRKRGTVPVDQCAHIERASSRVVRRWDLRPQDWHIHWPELVGTEGAPPVPGPDAPPPAAPPAGTAARPRFDWPALAGNEGAPPGPDAAAPPLPTDWPVCVRRTERHDGPIAATPTTETTHAA
jgi:DNA-binding transcriptional regulator YdaS (Cro superfamily)